MTAGAKDADIVTTVFLQNVTINELITPPPHTHTYFKT